MAAAEEKGARAGEEATTLCSDESDSEWSEVDLSLTQSAAFSGYDLLADSFENAAQPSEETGDVLDTAFEVTLTTYDSEKDIGNAKRKGGELDEAMKRELRKLQRELRRQMHQLHLLCLLSRHVLCQR
jgi:hypothetical protein